MKLSFFVPGNPKPQPRPRAYHTFINGKVTARVFNPETTDGWKAMIRVYAQNAQHESLHLRDAEVAVNFLMPRPKHHFLKSGLRSYAPAEHIIKPDLDNLAKAVLDALTDSGRFWDDDGAVHTLTLKKFYNQDPGVQITISAP